MVDSSPRENLPAWKQYEPSSPVAISLMDGPSFLKLIIITLALRNPGQLDVTESTSSSSEGNPEIREAPPRRVPTRPCVTGLPAVGRRAAEPNRCYWQLSSAAVWDRHLHH